MPISDPRKPILPRFKLERNGIGRHRVGRGPHLPSLTVFCSKNMKT